MTFTPIRITIKTGHTVTFDGAEYEVLGRATPGDTYHVQGPDGETAKRHVDWFADMAAKADRVVIE